MEIIEGASLPVWSWAPTLEPGARDQARNCASLPVAFHHVAVMADGHQGYGVPIGAVVALRGALSPYAVGNDIGCGMAVVPTTLTRDDVLGPVPTRSGGPGPVVRDEIMGSVQSTIPSGNAAHKHPVHDRSIESFLATAFGAMEEASELADMPLSNGATVPVSCSCCGGAGAIAALRARPDVELCRPCVESLLGQLGVNSTPTLPVVNMTDAVAFYQRAGFDVTHLRRRAKGSPGDGFAFVDYAGQSMFDLDDAPRHKPHPPSATRLSALHSCAGQARIARTAGLARDLLGNPLASGRP